MTIIIFSQSAKSAAQSMTRLLADLSVTTPVGVRVFRVEITSIFRTSDGRRIASVTALPKDGYQVEPFCITTHGGPMQTSHTQVPLPSLFNVHIEGENYANRLYELHDAQFNETIYSIYDR
jgi:hypothetical protein